MIQIIPQASGPSDILHLGSSYQPMVVGPNSTPTEIPYLGCSEEGNYAVQTAQC